jgi:Amt family ammonium transporter
VCNGVLCGFVAITAGCHVLEPWAAIIDGAVASLVFEGVCVLWLKLKIDDPLGAAPMHGFAGAWGLFCVGLLAKEEYVLQAYGGTHTADNNIYPYGCFYPQDKGVSGKLLASQVGRLIICEHVSKCCQDTEVSVWRSMSRFSLVSTG